MQLYWQETQRMNKKVHCFLRQFLLRTDFITHGQYNPRNALLNFVIIRQVIDFLFYSQCFQTTREKNKTFWSTWWLIIKEHEQDPVPGQSCLRQLRKWCIIKENGWKSTFLVPIPVSVGLQVQFRGALGSTCQQPQIAIPAAMNHH